MKQPKTGETGFVNCLSTAVPPETGSIAEVSLRQIADTEESHLQQGFAVLKEPVSLLERLKSLYGQLLVQVPREEWGPLVTSILFMHAYMTLPAAVLSTLRAHQSIGMTLARIAIDAASQADVIRRNPGAAKVWFNKDSDEQAYKRAFSHEMRYPKGDCLLESVRQQWKILSNFASHPFLTAASHRFNFGMDAIRVSYFDVQSHDAKVEVHRALLYLFRTYEDVGRVFHRCFEPIARAGWLEKLAFLRQEYRNHIRSHPELAQVPESPA